jgi:hypothetical protein
MFRRENPCLQPFGARTAAANTAMVESMNDASRTKRYLLRDYLKAAKLLLREK